MRLLKAFLILLLGFLPLASWASAKVEQSAVAGAQAVEAAEQGLSAKAGIVFEMGPIAVTNSMIVTILVTLVIVIFAQVVSRNVKPIPDGAANFAEWIVESLYNFLGSILGEGLVKKTFWFFGSLFLFILTTNWIGLLPGVGTVGKGYYDQQNHFHLVTPFFRGGNADLNMTSAMAILFFAMWIVWALQSNGVVGFLKHIFAPKGDSKGIIGYLLIPIFLFVGVLELMSIAFRPVSLSFRLYGNIFAGENILDAMMHIVPALSWIIPLPFYFLELLVGLVQALVFTLLTAVFTRLICDHGHEEHADDEHGAEHAKH